MKKRIGSLGLTPSIITVGRMRNVQSILDTLCVGCEVLPHKEYLENQDRRYVTSYGKVLPVSDVKFIVYNILIGDDKNWSIVDVVMRSKDGEKVYCDVPFVSQPDFNYGFARSSLVTFRAYGVDRIY